MKITKKIFSLFNLVLFIGTFCFTSLSAMVSKPAVQSTNHVQKQFAAKQDVEGTSSLQYFLEKNENENENENESNFQVETFILPFFVSYFQFTISECNLIEEHPLAIKYTNPIYLSVCNFRV